MDARNLPGGTLGFPKVARGCSRVHEGDLGMPGCRSGYPGKSPGMLEISRGALGMEECCLGVSPGYLKNFPGFQKWSAHHTKRIKKF